MQLPWVQASAHQRGVGATEEAWLQRADVSEMVAAEQQDSSNIEKLE